MRLAWMAAGLLALSSPATARTGPGTGETSVQAAEVEAAFGAFIRAGRAGDQPAMQALTDALFIQHHGYGLTEIRPAWLEGQGPARPSAETIYLEIAPSIRIRGPPR